MFSKLILREFYEIVQTMKPSFQAFIFEGYDFFESDKKVILRYSFDSEVFFEEEFVFDFEFVDGYTKQTLDAALFGLWVMVGISYFKTVLPPVIKFKSGGLNQVQKDFFEKVYLHGLGEFFYTNGIDPRGKINFEVGSGKWEGEMKGAIGSEFRVPNFELHGSIVPIGGGKDSLVTAELLKESGEDFETFTVKPTPLLDHVCEKIGKPQLRVFRKISPQLLKLNEQGALNGHVPITAILSFLSVVTAVLRGKKNIIFSNEASAEEGNVEFHGFSINHQYSKTLEFERDFQEYVSTFICSDIQYFSLLRPLAELRVAQVFCSKIFQKYKKDFSSCNRNFHFGSNNMSVPKTPLSPPFVRGEKRVIWCGECPKCGFVFAIFSPFLPREELINLFGKNLFTDPEMGQIFRELLGLEGIKPFECVGSVEEVRQALRLARGTGEWFELERFEIPEGEFDYDRIYPDIMPDEFRRILRKVITGASDL